MFSEFIKDIKTPIVIADEAFGLVDINESSEYFLDKYNLTTKKFLSEVKKINDKNSFKFGRNTHLSKMNSYHINLVVYKIDFMHNIYYFIMFKNRTGAIELDLITTYMDDGICILKGDGQFVLVNQKYNENSGSFTEYRIGTRIQDMEKKGQLDDPIYNHVLRNKAYSIKTITYRASKENPDKKAVASVSGNPCFDRRGNVSYVICSNRNITELVKIKNSLSQLEEAQNKYIKKIDELDKPYVIPNVVYKSPEMKSIMNLVEKISPKDSSVFIYGETGVGKEVIARSIHDKSSRKDKPFIAINCATIPENLFESELFGYEEGSFTGAKKGGKKGVFEAANGGTLFLDEIGEMPISMQSKLLRAIQEGSFNKVGGVKPISVNIRFIAATNIGVNDLIDNVKLRQDLYYRLAVVPIYIPPLRDRKSDIDVLIDYFINIFNNKYNSKIKMSTSARKELNKYSWPGNIRELRNAIERYVILYEANNTYLGSDNSVLNILGLNNTFQKNDETKADNANSTLAEYINQREKEYIVSVCQKCSSIPEAAKVLGISLATMYRKMDKLGIVPKDIL